MPRLFVMGHRLAAALAIICITASLLIPAGNGAWGVYSQPGYDEGRSIAATDDSVYVGALSIGRSLGSFSGYRLLKYNASGDVAWERTFSVPDRRMTREGYRNVAVAATSTSVRVAYSNGTFEIKAFHANGTQMWENRWRRPCSVTDMEVTGNHTIVTGCVDGIDGPRFHVVAFDDRGDVAWNTSGRGCIYGIDVDGGTIHLAGERDGSAIFLSMNDTGGVTGSRSFGAGAALDIIATPDGITLLYSPTADNISIVTIQSPTDENETRRYYGKPATGNALLAAEGRVFIAGSVYNQSARYRDFMVAECLANGTFTDVVRYNGNGSGDDVAWDVAELDGIVATGATYTQQIIPPNQVIINREVYTTPYTPGNLPPSADFTWDLERPRANDHVSFTENATDPDGSIVQWTWSFGDGGTSSRQNPGHVYTDKGVYTVTLTVGDDDGATDTATKEIVVAEEEKTPGFSAVLAGLAAALAVMLRRRLTFK